MPHDEIVERARLLQAARRTPALQRLLLARCRQDIRFWFNRFCWTFDPRLSLPHRPFVLYPYQEEALAALVAAIERGEDLLIEKSRDMGVSWLVLLAFQYYWLFRQGANFHLGSRKQESVDRKGDPSTLMEKLRYNLDWLPDWMKPEGFSEIRHDNQLRLINPANGNVITGESSNENFGRGGRYKAVLFDEFPFWPMQDAAFASAGQSSPCRIVVGTPYGKQNRFADLRFSGAIRTLRIHWRLHPNRGDAWYALQQSRMSEDEVARELDINYHLSVRERVFRNFTEEHQGDPYRELYGDAPKIIPDRELYGDTPKATPDRNADGDTPEPAPLGSSQTNPACSPSSDTFPARNANAQPLGSGTHEFSLNPPARRIIRSWDFGYHCPACLFIFLDADHRLLVLDEAVGKEDLLVDFAGRVLEISKTRFPSAVFEDICDPAGAQHSDKNAQTSIEILNSLGVYPQYVRSRIHDGLELIRMKLSARTAGQPDLMVDRRCEKLIEAFEGGYRYGPNGGELPLQEHPFEDVMDCLRYAVIHKCGVIPNRQPRRKPRPYHPANRYTGY